MVRKADLLKPERHRAARVFDRLTHGVPAKRRVHVIIGWHSHAPIQPQPTPSAKEKRNLPPYFNL